MTCRSIVFTAEARSDLHWWVVNATNENGVFLQKLQDIVSIQGVSKKRQPLNIHYCSDMTISNSTVVRLEGILNSQGPKIFCA